MIKISVVILSYNRISDLKKNLISLLSVLPSEFEVITVDNASTDGSREFLKEINQKNPKIKTIFLDENMGVAIGRNSGFSLSKGDYIVSLDDDAQMNVEDIKKVPALFLKYRNAGILAFKVCHAQTGDLQNDHGERVVPIANFHGAGHAIRKAIFEKVGYLDEFCTFGGEEFDFSVRCHSAGFQTLYIPEVIVHHNSFLRPGPSGADRRVKWVYNYVRILFKHFPPHMAYLFSFRHLYMMVRSGHAVFGFQLVSRLIKSAIRGRHDGIVVHSVVPYETILFYKDPNLQPEYGNAPINFKKRLMGRLNRTLRNGGGKAQRI